jgi:hypothetical protein
MLIGSYVVDKCDVDKKLQNRNFWFEFLFVAFNNHSTVDVGNISDSELI